MKKIFIGYQRLELREDEPMYAISVVSRITAIPVWTLRILDKQRVVCPKKTEGNTRLYSRRDLEKLHKVCYLMKVKKVNVGGLKVLEEVLEMEW